VTDRTRVLVVDDHAQFRTGLRALLSSVPELELVGEAASGQEAVVLAERLQPDVILMDISMPGLNGLEATRRIVRDSPHQAVVMLTMLEDDDSVFEALQAGARGYLLKGALRAEILRAVRAVSSGEAIFGPAIARRLVHFFASARRHDVAAAFPALSERERDVLRLMTEHRTNPEIAARLQLAPKTVRNHVSNILVKLQVASRAEAIVRAREAGLAPSGKR
jgi:DNA-binding NarL/FixJ family response regulator